MSDFTIIVAEVYTFLNGSIGRGMGWELPVSLTHNYIRNAEAEPQYQKRLPYACSSQRTRIYRSSLLQTQRSQ